MNNGARECVLCGGEESFDHYIRDCCALEEERAKLKKQTWEELYHGTEEDHKEMAGFLQEITKKKFYYYN